MDLTPIVAALQGKQWLLLSALLLLTFCGLAKQGQLGVWLQRALPARFLPFLAPLLGIAGTWAAEVVAGKPWSAALVDALINGVQAGMGATLLHEVIVEGARGGREIVPAKSRPSSSSNLTP
jgi:hypothetical protein